MFLIMLGIISQYYFRYSTKNMKRTKTQSQLPCQLQLDDNHGDLIEAQIYFGKSSFINCQLVIRVLRLWRYFNFLVREDGEGVAYHGSGGTLVLTWEIFFHNLR